MVNCERCGTGYGPIQAAVLEFCPRCKARDQINVSLVVARVKDGSPQSSPEVIPPGEGAAQTRASRTAASMPPTASADPAAQASRISPLSEESS